MTGMVNVPVVTTLAIDEPEIMPVMPEARIAALAGPPLNRPTSANDRARKYFPAPALSRRAPNSTNRNTKLTETLSGMPKTASPVSH